MAFAEVRRRLALVVPDAAAAVDPVPPLGTLGAGVRIAQPALTPGAAAATRPRRAKGTPARAWPS